MTMDDTMLDTTIMQGLWSLELVAYGYILFRTFQAFKDTIGREIKFILLFQMVLLLVPTICTALIGLNQ